MFRHKGALISTSVVLLLFATAQTQSNSRSYDTNDWIPVSRSCPTCFQNEDTQSDGVQKRPTGRVLNLPTPDQKRLFPPEQSDSSPQSYNIPLKQQEEKQQLQQQARLLQNQGQYPHPQIALPPQLQSLINQGQPFLSPQRINNQLLQAPNGIAYQPTLQTVPQFALNSTQFNSRDVVQNINLGLYNQQSTKQQPQITQPQNIKPNGNSDREEVQLLYVPLENLRQSGQRQQIAFPNEQRLPAPQAYNQPTAQQYQPVQHKQAQLQNIQQDFVQQALQAQKLQEQFQHNVSPVPQQNFRRPYVPDPITHEPTTTSAPKKRKPHQPPLAVYMGTEGHSEIKLGDVLTLLKDAKTISVQDNIGPDAPQVFVGPSHLAPPDGYVKFDLPYLSSIESNRVERKVDQLPFFVAPLSYKAPPGYSKIPFPAPHVGSVVINHIQASSQEQTTTENVQHFLNQNIHETSSHTPYSSAEITTVRTRGRQRQPSRASYAASTVQTPVTPEIAYGPLPTKVPPSAEQQHSVQESLISPNPYGPTQFVQSTTPSIYENPASLPQQIFSTKNRFSTPNYNAHKVQSIPERHNQFVQQVQEIESTEHTPLATTLSDVISDEKYTVLEQFPLPEKSASNKYSQTNVPQNTPQRVPSRHHSRGRPTENYYNDESKTETPLPLVSNEQYSNEQYLVEAPVNSPYLQNQHEIPVQQYVTQAVPTKQIPLEHDSKDTKKPTAQEPSVQHQYEPQEISTKEIPLEHYNHQQQQQHIVQESPVQHYSSEKPHHDEILANQQYSIEQTSAEYEKSVRQSRPHSRVRGKQHFTPEPYYREEYETPNVKETSTRHEPLLNQQVVQYQTPVYDSREQELPISTQATRGRGRPEHTPETYFKEDYVSQNIKEAPVRHEVALNKQVNEQPTEYVSQEIQLQKHQLQNTRGRDYDSHESSLQQVNPQVTSDRGKPQLSPETYRQEYEQHDVKLTEPEVHVTTKPIVNYEIPIISTQKSIERTGRPQYDPETYYRDVSEQPRVQEQQQHQQQYTLPSQLPPISPHLPGLVNSLQDQAIRPLLAPLLLPPSEEPPVTEYTSEYYTTPFTTTTTTTSTTTTTPVPIVETTTQFKRTRGRQRGTRPTASYEYVNTTPTSHQRTSSYRGRRPYTRTRQQSHEKNVPVSSTAQPEVVTETSTRAAFNRNRYVQRERQYVSSTTEQPRRQPTNSRQRFRTRGRPLKTDEDYAVRSTTENVPDFKQPSFEGGFQATLPVDHSNAELPVQMPNNNPQSNIQNDQFLNQKQQEQALVYVQNSNKQIVPESNPIQISSEEYIPREHFISSTEIVEPLHQTTIAPSAPENNIVSDVLHNEPVVLVNHKINQEQSNYPNVELNTNRNIEYSSNEDINVNTPRVKYIEEPEVRIQPTTESVRIRSRIRGRPRTRGYQSTSSSRYQAPSPTTTTTTTTTQRTMTESKEEDQEEFYGFFRPPSFVKPIKMEYKASSELRTAVNPTPTVAYLHNEEQNVYVSPVGNPVYSTPATHLHVSQVDDSQADHNIRTQYVSNTPDIRTQYAPPAESSEEEEEIVDIKPVTRRPPSSFNRARRPIAPTKVEDHTDIPSRVTEKYYTVRPTKRPETQTQKVTRIRGRIRRPTRPTTVAPIIETESSYSGNQQQQQQHYSRTNELSHTHSDEYVTPVKPRQRIINRGKSHFQLPRNEKIALEPESNNYPPSFLQAQQNHHQQAETRVNIPEVSAQKSVNIVSAEEVHTAKPSFQLTIEPEEGDEEYADQIPYTSINKHRIDINLDEGAESKYSAKIVAKPSNYNFIVTNEKNNGNIDKTTEKPTSTEIIDYTTVKNEPVVTETEEPLVTFQQLTTAFPEIDIPQSSESTTTDIPTTLESVTDTPQARRRGIWRLVKLRPVGDDFESAESQNIGTVFNNNFDVEKPVRKYHSVKRIRTTTEEAQEEITTAVPPKVVNNQQNHVPTPESDIFAPLYEMFGYNRERSILDNGFDILPSDDDTVTTTVLPTINNIFSDDVELTTLSNYNTTEINQDFSSIKEEDKIEMYSDRLAKLGDKEAEPSTQDSWRTRIIGTSTTTEISHETEICYRGRCVKSSSEESSERL